MSFKCRHPNKCKRVVAETRFGHGLPFCERHLAQLPDGLVQKLEAHAENSVYDIDAIAKASILVGQGQSRLARAIPKARRKTAR